MSEQTLFLPAYISFYNKLKYCGAIFKKSVEKRIFKDSFPEKTTENGSLVDFKRSKGGKGCSTYFYISVSLCLTHSFNTFMPSEDHKLFFLQFHRRLVRSQKTKKNKKSDVTNFFKKNNRNIGLRVHWPYEQASSLLRFVHKPYSMHKRQARESDTVPARFQLVLMLQDSWRRTRHCWVRIRNWNREQTDVVKRLAQSKSRLIVVLRKRGLFSVTKISVS